ncbi:hypothetical protein Q0Y04_07795 [Clostridioides difficile]|nr:hypothetical protein Q0Y04_07795 [Clostridioides difficile]
MLEANLGLRISDILRLKIGNFKGNMLEINEKRRANYSIDQLIKI